MEKFYESFTFVMAFMISSLVIDMAFGEKFLRAFLLLVLFGMVAVNSDKLIAFMDGKFTNEEKTQAEEKTKEETLKDADKAGSGNGGLLG